MIREQYGACACVHARKEWECGRPGGQELAGGRAGTRAHVHVRVGWWVGGSGWVDGRVGGRGKVGKRVGGQAGG